MKTFTAELTTLKEKQLFRSLRTAEGAPGRTVTIDRKEYINFSSNNYCGFANHAEVKKAAMDAVALYGAGASASRLVSGTLIIHRTLERSLAQLKKTDDTLVFPTGYQANIGAVTSLAGKGDHVICDRLCHASLIDAARLSGAKLLVYPHRDTEQLKKILSRLPASGTKLVITDGIFSMDGDIAPLKDLHDCCVQQGALLLVDDAHGTGVLGRSGSGCLEHAGLHDTQIIMIGTLSKALGSSGGFVAGSRDLIELLINKARSFIYTTGLNPAACGAALKAIELVGKEPWRRERLRTKAQYLRKKLQDLGFNTLDSQSPIIPVIIGDVPDTLYKAEQLMDRGIFCPAIRPPTVPRGQARLRISLTCDHTDEDYERLISGMQV